MNVNSESGNSWLLAGTKVFAYESAWNNISSALSYSVDVSKWTGCMLSDIPVLNNPDWYPEYWAPQISTQVLLPLMWDAVDTWQIAGYRSDVIRSHKQFLIAMGMYEPGSNYYPDVVRWSDAADVGGLPPSWDETVPTNLAGKVSLGGELGHIIDGLSLRDSFIIYRERGVTVMDYVGGTFVWRFRHMMSSSGLLNKNCVVEVDGLHYYLSDGDILINDGSNIKSLIHNKIRRRLLAKVNENTAGNSYVLSNDSFKEIWFCVPEDGSVFASTAFIYNTRDNTWAIRDLPNVAHAAYGPQAAPTRTWNDWLQTWDTATGVWGQESSSIFSNTIVGIENAAATSTLFLDRNVDDSSTGVVSRIERIGLPIVGHIGVTTLTRIYPHMSGSLPVEIEIGSQDYPGSPVRWQPPAVFDPSADRKLDVRTTGELHCFRISSYGTAGWRLSGMDFEFVKAGVR
jgi:hypothetical protein